MYLRTRSHISGLFVLIFLLVSSSAFSSDDEGDDDGGGTSSSQSSRHRKKRQRLLSPTSASFPGPSSASASSFYASNYASSAAAAAAGAGDFSKEEGSSASAAAAVSSSIPSAAAAASPASVTSSPSGNSIRPQFDLAFLPEEGSTVSIDLINLESFHWQSSGLEYKVYQAILEVLRAGLEATYRDGQVVSRFIYPFEIISFNQQGQPDLDEEIRDFEIEYGRYTGTASTFSESVANLLRSFREQNPEERARLNRERISRSSSQERNDVVVDILLSQENIDRFVAHFVPALAESGSDAVHAIQKTVAAVKAKYTGTPAGAREAEVLGGSAAEAGSASQGLSVSEE